MAEARNRRFRQSGFESRRSPRRGREEQAMGCSVCGGTIYQNQRAVGKTDAACLDTKDDDIHPTGAEHSEATMIATTKSDERIWECPSDGCGEEFTTFEDLSAHVQTHVGKAVAASVPQQPTPKETAGFPSASLGRQSPVEAQAGARPSSHHPPADERGTDMATTVRKTGRGAKTQSNLVLATVKEAMATGDALDRIAKKLDVGDYELKVFIDAHRSQLASVLRFKCSACDYRAYGGQGLSRHLDDAHKGKATAEVTKPRREVAEANGHSERTPRRTKVVARRQASPADANGADARMVALTGDIEKEIADYEASLAALKAAAPGIDKKRSLLKALKAIDA